MIPGNDLRCRQDAEVACWGPIMAPDGSAIFALVTVCKHHVRPAMRWLKDLTPAPESIEAWRLEAFIEHYGLIAREIGDIHVLREVA